MSFHKCDAFFDFNEFSERRKIMKLTQEDVARYCGVSQNTISSIEIGAFVPRLHLYYKLCQCVNAPFGYFLNEE